MQSKILLLLAALLFSTQIFSQKKQKPKDSGLLVITLGADTTFVHDFEIRGDSFFSKILTFPNGLRLVEGRGAFFQNGDLRSVESSIATLDKAGNWQPTAKTWLMTTADSTILETLREGKTSRRSHPGRCIVTNSGDAASFQLFPFYGFRAPRRVGDSVIFRHVNPIGVRDFVVKRTARRMVEIGSSFMGKITLNLDKRDRLLSVNALGSSLNFTAQVFRNHDFEQLKKHFSEKQVRGGAAPLAISTRDTARFETAGGQKIEVNYWRPSARGRKIFGEIVPRTKFWRLGANHATEVSLAQPLVFENGKLEAGKYTLFAVPTAAGWQLCFNRKTGIWGTEYDATADMLRVLLREEVLPEHVEKLTISVAASDSGGVFRVDWERTRLAVDFGF